MADAVGGVVAKRIGENELDGGQGGAAQLETLHHGDVVADVLRGDQSANAQAPNADAQDQAGAAVHDGQYGGELRLVDGQVG